ncbi:MAG: hypothetical protein KL863_18550 [Rhizobium sp.]|nr:hypothetical protein [Rhizobium sp.]
MSMMTMSSGPALCRPILENRHRQTGAGQSIARNLGEPEQGPSFRNLDTPVDPGDRHAEPVPPQAEGYAAVGVWRLFADRFDPKSRQLAWQAPILKFVCHHVRGQPDGRVDHKVLQRPGHPSIGEHLHADTLDQQGQDPAATESRSRRTVPLRRSSSRLSASQGSSGARFGGKNRRRH